MVGRALPSLGETMGKTHWPIREVSSDGRKTRYRCGCGGFTGSWRILRNAAEKAYRSHVEKS